MPVFKLLCLENTDESQLTVLMRWKGFRGSEDTLTRLGRVYNVVPQFFVATTTQEHNATVYRESLAYTYFLK